MADPTRKSSTKRKQPLKKEALIELIWIDIVEGMSRYQIMLKLERDAYDGFETSKLSRTSRYNYVQEAYNNCKVELGEEKERQRDLFYERILSVYNDAVDARDRANALKALEMAAKLSGVYNDKQEVNVTGTINANITFGLEDEEDNDD